MPWWRGSRASSGSSWCSAPATVSRPRHRSEEHTSELQSQSNLVCRLLLEKKKKNIRNKRIIASTKPCCMNIQIISTKTLQKISKDIYISIHTSMNTYTLTKQYNDIYYTVD